MKNERKMMIPDLSSASAAGTASMTSSTPAMSSRADLPRRR